MLETLDKTLESCFKDQPSDRPYTRQAIDNYALYHAVKLIDTDNIEHIGWLVPKDKYYILLPFNNIWKIYSITKTAIKAIYHLTNGVLIPKDFKG